MSLPMHLRSYQEKSKDEAARDFFNAPVQEALPLPGAPPSVVKLRGAAAAAAASVNPRELIKGGMGMDINAVLSVEGKEEVYVSCRQGGQGDGC
jgi:hypothetical protein